VSEGIPTGRTYFGFVFIWAVLAVPSAHRGVDADAHFTDRAAIRHQMRVIDQQAVEAAVGETAGRIEQGRSDRIAQPVMPNAIAAETDARVDADVKAGPVVDGGQCGSFGVRAGGEVCGECRGGSEARYPCLQFALVGLQGRWDFRDRRHQLLLCSSRPSNRAACKQAVRRNPALTP
jgi:hypothetical protein